MKKLVLITTIIFSLSSFNISFAQTADDLNNTLSTKSGSYCYNTLVAVMDIHHIEFLTFLDETFRSKNTNSSLVNYLSIHVMVQSQTTIYHPP